VTNREVYAVPGNITSRNSFGTNYLIKGAGAKLVQTRQGHNVSTGRMLHFGLHGTITCPGPLTDLFPAV